MSYKDQPHEAQDFRIFSCPSLHSDYRILNVLNVLTFPQFEVRDLRQKLHDAEGILLNQRNEIVGLNRQLEALGRDLHASRINRARVEEETRAHVSS